MEKLSKRYLVADEQESLEQPKVEELEADSATDDDADDDEEKEEMGDTDEPESAELKKRERKMRPYHEVITPTVEKFLELLSKKTDLEVQLSEINDQLLAANEILQRNDAIRHPMVARNRNAKTWLEANPLRTRKRKKVDDKVAFVINELQKIASVIEDQEANMLIEDAMEKIAKEQSDNYDKRNLYDVDTIKEKKDREYPEHSAAERSLSTRYCPDHYGSQMMRVAEGTYQCELDGKMYNWNTGFEDYSGNKFVSAPISSIDFPNMLERPFETRDIATKKRL